MTTTAGDAAQIRRYYERRRVPVCSAARARRDVLALLDQRKALQRAGEALMTAATPYSGDPTVRAAIDAYRAVLEGRAAE